MPAPARSRTMFASASKQIIVSHSISKKTHGMHLNANAASHPVSFSSLQVISPFLLELALICPVEIQVVDFQFFSGNLTLET